MLTLGIRYLTGYAVATDVSSRDAAEWPPHPARVFMAMAAALFETSEDAEERSALEWLERQTPPAIKASNADARDIVVYYVPPNDMEAPKNPAKLMPEGIRDALNIFPMYRLKKQPRTFPCVRPWEDIVFLIWPEAQPSARQRAAIDHICAKVVRIGHSSSLVQMWVENKAQEPTIRPTEFGEHQLRVACAGTLNYLESIFNAEAVDSYAELQMRLASAKGKARRELKQEIEERFGNKEPTSQRPVISRWQAYERIGGVAPSVAVTSGAFDSHLMVLAIDEGPVIGLESTWSFLTALRNAILSNCDPTPEWISGHQKDGSPTKSDHLALLPLAFVDHEHADGHLMGAAIAFPKGITPRERGQSLSGLCFDMQGQLKPIELRLGALGNWTLVRETRISPPRTLRAETWTTPSSTWATVTPIVLDRQPKSERANDRQRWSLEVAEIVADSCEKQGLPRPIAVDIDKTSWHRGALRAVAGNGAGFALAPVKVGQPKRQQVHAWLRFEVPVEGPLLLGAGRYRGYGLCRPWTEHSR
ncbi:MAG: type I-U CRISPR-associated protein Csb2 [Verrucomicrobiales bacterium]|nr:type I-U CRISPR-associated protein Csb2 [Verrucomicrobiales bacterium]